jgi:hypothetical protein
MTSTIADAYAMFIRVFQKPRRYSGTSIEICRQIIDECNTSSFFKTSCGHFSQFYCRDFGMCAQHLCELGYESDVKKTLLFAKRAFESHSRITTTIRSDGTCVDYFACAPDSLAFFIKAVLVTKDSSFIALFTDFFRTQAQIVFTQCIDQQTLRLKKQYFSTAKDHYIRFEAFYDWCALDYCSRMLSQLHIPHAFSQIPFDDILESYWHSTYYLEDLQQRQKMHLPHANYSHLASDAQIFAFYWHDTLTKKQQTRLKLCIKNIQQLRLDSPVPIQYCAVRNRAKELFLPSLFAPNYEGTTHWLHIGLCYVEVVAKINPRLAKSYLRSIDSLIQTHGTFLELYSRVSDVSCTQKNTAVVAYRSLLYRSDEGMLWCSIWLNLARTLGVISLQRKSKK